MTQTVASLQRRLRLTDIVTLGAGAAIGVAIFSIFAPAAAIAGPGMLISLAIAAFPMIIFAVVYAFMSSAMPLSGASFAWPTRFIGPFVGFMIAWLRILASTGAMVVLAQVLVQYWSTVLALPLKPTMFVIFLVFYLLNLFGVSVAAKAQRLLFSLMLVALFIFFVGSIRHLEISKFAPLLPHGWSGVWAAVPLLVTLFLGIENAVEVGEEVREAHKTISLGIALCVGVTIVVYASICVACLGSLGAAALAHSEAPLLEAARLTLGRAAAGLILTAATLALAKSLNAVLLIFSRYLFAMGREGALPQIVGRVHPRWGTPHVATTVAFACCAIGLCLPTNLIFLYLAVNIPTMLKYLGTCVAALRLIGNRPDLYEQAWFKPSRRALCLWAWAGVLSALTIVALGLGTDWRPYVALLAWGAIGALYWIAKPAARLARNAV